MKKYCTYITFYTGDKLPKWYIGSSYEEKILNGYNGSIKSKKWKDIYQKEQKENKHLFKTKILSFHDNKEEAINEEYRLQRMHNVVKNEKYFNESYASINGFFGRDVSGKNNPMYGKHHSDKTKCKISRYQRTPEICLNISKSKIGNTPWMKGKKHTEESKNKMRENSPDYHGENNPFFGKKHSDDTIEKIRKGNIGRKESQDTRRKKSEARMGELNPMFGIKRPTVKCPHCEKEGIKGNMKRWHFDNCKMK